MGINKCDFCSFARPWSPPDHACRRRHSGGRPGRLFQRRGYRPRARLSPRRCPRTIPTCPARPSALPAEPAAESSFFDSLNPFSSSDSSSDLLAKAFTAKAELATAGTEPEPEAAAGPAQATIRARLTRAIAAGKDQFPEQAARAQADYDCWVLYGTVPSAAAASPGLQDRAGFLAAAAGNRCPSGAAAACSGPMPAPAPPCRRPHRRPLRPADFTVYFDFDSWTLKAEQLKVLDDVIATARSGGQTNITIVGHTDTSGPSDYNQKLSVKRANVVVEALVQMGARRTALHASGVGETDLAVADRRRRQGSQEPPHRHHAAAVT